MFVVQVQWDLESLEVLEDINTRDTTLPRQSMHYIYYILLFFSLYKAFLTKKASILTVGLR